MLAHRITKNPRYIWICFTSCVFTFPSFLGSIDIWVVDFCKETDFWGNHGIFIWKEQLQLEFTVFVWRAFWAGDNHIEIPQIIGMWHSYNTRNRVWWQSFSFLGHVSILEPYDELTWQFVEREASKKMLTLIIRFGKDMATRRRFLRNICWVCTYKYAQLMQKRALVSD